MMIIVFIIAIAMSKFGIRDQKIIFFNFSVNFVLNFKLFVLILVVLFF